jgi:hypothetical protein
VDAIGGNEAIQPHHASRIFLTFDSAGENIFADCCLVLDSLFCLYVLAKELIALSV